MSKVNSFLKPRNMSKGFIKLIIYVNKTLSEKLRTFVFEI